MGTMEKKTANPSIVIPPNMNYEYLEHGADFPLAVGAEGFNLVNAWWMAEASLLVYEHPGFARLVYRLHGFPGFLFHEGKSTEASLAYRDDAIILAFRGTEVKSMNAFADIVTDMKFLMRDFKGLGMVHAGFMDGLNEVWDGIVSDLSRLNEEKPRKIFVCGHSLGGAIATLAATLASASSMDLAALYTFGCPKVGDAAFAASVPPNHYRLVNYGDPIVQVPPPMPVIERFPGNFYKHSGHAWSFGEDHRLSEGEGVQQNLGSVLDGYVDAVTSKIKKKASSVISSVVSRMKGVEKESKSDDENKKEDLSLSGSVISMLKGTHMDSHAPVYYAIHAWNALVDSLEAG